MVAYASAAQPEGQHNVAKVQGTCRAMDSPATHNIPGLTNASPSNTQRGSRMREFRPYGSVRGAHGDMRIYRDQSDPHPKLRIAAHTHSPGRRVASPSRKHVPRFQS